MITPCIDMDYVKDFMTQPEIWRYAAEYGAEYGPIDFHYNGRKVWLSYSVEGESVGLIEFDIMTGTMAMIHPYIIRSHKQHYDMMIQEFFRWFLDCVPEQICKINVLIPDFCKGAQEASKRAGFKFEGLDTKSWLSEFGACDRFLLGIARGDIKCQV